MGYHRAGFEVVGVDLRPQPHYPFEFFVGDALDWLRHFLEEWEWPHGLTRFDGIHASPPCQHYSDLAHRNGNAADHPALVEPVRDLLEATGLPYVIENVEGAPLIDPKAICATERGLVFDGYRLRRHRLFETNWPLETPGCGCTRSNLPVLDVSGGGPTHAPRLDGKGGRTYKGTADQVREIMAIPWGVKAECNEAIPPAYTQLIAQQLSIHLEEVL